MELIKGCMIAAVGVEASKWEWIEQGGKTLPQMRSVSTAISYFIMQILKRCTWGASTEYHTWEMLFIFSNLSLSVASCPFQTSLTPNFSHLYVGISPHFIALMPTFVMLPLNAREWDRKRESLCEDVSWRECFSHNTPQMCLSPK